MDQRNDVGDAGRRGRNNLITLLNTACAESRRAGHFVAA
jgi:hypothetical protein